MNIYVIAWDYAYDGYSEPKRAFATREAAEEAIKGKEHRDPTPEIFELEVEGIPEPAYEYGVRYVVETGEEMVRYGYYWAPSYIRATEHVRDTGGTVVRRVKAGPWEEEVEG